MKKSILSALLALVMVLTMAGTPAQAATKKETKTAKPVKTSTKTITFKNFVSKEDMYQSFESIIKVTNVKSKKTKDFAMVYGTDKKLERKKSNVLYCKAPVTVSLQKEKDAPYEVVWDFNVLFNEKKVKGSSIKDAYKYYIYNEEEGLFECDKKLEKEPDGYFGCADGSSFKLTKKGTYAIYVNPVTGLDTTGEELSCVFIVVQ